jgi:hypothetical protein
MQAEVHCGRQRLPDLHLHLSPLVGGQHQRAEESSLPPRILMSTPPSPHCMQQNAGVNNHVARHEIDTTHTDETTEERMP